MDFEQILQQFGLNDNEVAVYLATLELGESTVLPISKKSGIKRTYCYDILADLGKKSLVTYFEKNNRRRYVAENPVKLGEILHKRLKEFNEILPELKSIYNQSGTKPKVRFYEGKDGIISIYEEMLKTKKICYAIASPNKITDYLGDFFEEFVKKTLVKKIQIRELVTPDGATAEYLAGYKKPLQEARVLLQGIKFNTDMIMYDEKLAMISYGPELHAVVIESSSIVETQRILFEIIWNVSRK